MVQRHGEPVISQLQTCGQTRIESLQEADTAVGDLLLSLESLARLWRTSGVHACDLDGQECLLCITGRPSSSDWRAEARVGRLANSSHDRAVYPTCHRKGAAGNMSGLSIRILRQRRWSSLSALPLLFVTHTDFRCTAARPVNKRSCQPLC